MKSKVKEAGQIFWQRKVANVLGTRVRTKGRPDLKISTWNVHSLYRASTLKSLLEQLSLYQPGVVAIQEIRWTGSGILERKDYTIDASLNNISWVLDL